MDSGKYDRAIILYCSVCASSDFDTELDNSESVVCASCGTEFTREELRLQNLENIETHRQEIIQEVTNDFTKQLKDAFKGSDFIKVK